MVEHAVADVDAQDLAGDTERLPQVDESRFQWDLTTKRVSGGREHPSELADQLELAEGGDDAAFIAGCRRKLLDVAREALEERRDASVTADGDLDGVDQRGRRWVRGKIALRSDDDPWSPRGLCQYAAVRRNAR